MITHIHHVKPRHMGGSNDPSNLLECTIEEHANLHLSLYLESGKIEDWIAFHMLSGQTEEGERARRQMSSEYMKTRTITEETRSKMSKGQKKRFSKPGSRVLTPAKVESIKKMTGEGNPFYGKRHTEENRKIISEKAKEQWSNTKYIWVNNREVCRRVSEDNIPQGFLRGRLKRSK